MWTRSTISIKNNGKIVHTQYNQWDGYPTGQGAGIREFFEKHHEWNDISVFASHVYTLKILTEQDCETINKLHPEDWKTIYPQLSRDHGYNILESIFQKDGLEVNPDWACLRPNIWIEWSYLIDLDTNQVHVFEWSTMTGKEDDEVTEADRNIGPNISPEKDIAKPLYTFSLLNPPTEEEWATQFKDY